MSWLSDAANAVGSAVEGAVDKVDGLGREMGLGSLTSPVADFVDSKIDAVRDDLDAVSSAKYPALGFDPAPGSVGTIETLAQQLSGAAGKLVDAGRDINRVGQSGSIWQGQGADGFHDKVGELPPLLDQANQALGKAAHLLGTWSSDLSSMQTTAAGYERQAEAASSSLDAVKANPDLRLANQVLPRDEIPAAQARLGAAVSKVMRAQQELDDIIEQAKRLQRQHRELAEDIAKALRQASDDAPVDTVWNQIGEGLDALGHEIAALKSGVWGFIQDHADLINEVSTIVGDISAVLGVVGVIADCTGLGAVVGVPLNGLALALGAAAVAGHCLAKGAGADVTWMTLATDTIAVVPAAGAAAKAFEAGTRTLQATDDGFKLLKGADALAALPKGDRYAVEGASNLIANATEATVTTGLLTTPYVSNQLGFRHIDPLYNSLGGDWQTLGRYRQSASSHINDFLA